MMESLCDISTTEGRMKTFITHPEQGGPFPVVLFYMDSFGIREELRAMARRVAAAGYLVVLPDLHYQRTGQQTATREGFDVDGPLHHTPHLSIQGVMQDTAALLACVAAEPKANANLIGAVGYCMSGAFVLAAAGTFPDRIKCAASIYGVNLLTERADSPHLLAGRTRGELYFACAENDEYAPRKVMEQLEEYLGRSGANYRLEWYPGAQHGFAFVERQDAYDRVSAERHWERLLDLLERNLRDDRTG
jgi:carboxymethylenebutenolidase